mgnify:CR=1 FL=1
MIARHESSVSGLLVALLSLLALSTLVQAISNGQPQRLTPAGRYKRQAGASELLDWQANVNLKTIFEHQTGLAEECAKYHDEKLRQLEYLIKFEEERDGQVQLQHPLPVQVPAVCLFLFSQFKRSKPMESSADRQGRLEFVNWIFDEEEIRRNSGKNFTKRQTEQQRSTLNNKFLSDYLVDPEAPANYAANPPDTNEMVEFHENINTLMGDGRFHQLIDNNRPKIAGHLSPVILVPGLLGSRLQVKTDKLTNVNIFCSKQADWKDVWLSLRMLLPLAVDCWIDNVRLEFDPATGFTKEPPGVESRVPDFGSVESVSSLDLRQPTVTQYFAAIIERYEQLGYTVDQNLLAAPYDFRLAPQELGDYFVMLKGLIERAQESSPSGKKVTLVCHSMGCTHLLVFLRLQSAAWRQSRVRKMIAISSPWGGSAKALKALVVGDQLDLPLISESKMRKLARTYPSIAYLLPQAEIFSRTNKNLPLPGGPILVRTPERDYRVSNIDQLLLDLNLTHQLDWYKASVSLIKPLEPLLDVRVDCIHSLNSPTPETILFRKQSDFPNGNYELIKGEGDGTVNFESLMVCDDWARTLPDKVKHIVIMNTNHVGVLTHKTTLTHITDDVLTT